MKKYLLGLLCALLLIGSLDGCQKSSPKILKDVEQQLEITPEVKKQSFDEFLEECYIKDLTSSVLTYVQFVENPKNYGITDYEHVLMDYSKNSFDESMKESEELYDKLLSYDYNSLSKEQKIDYDYFKYLLEENIAFKDLFYYQEPLSTLDGDHITIPAVAALHSTRFFESLLANNNQDIKSIEKFFEFYTLTGEYFQQVAQFEREKADQGLFMSQMRAKEVVKHCSQVIINEGTDIGEGFAECVDQANWLTKEEKESLKIKNQQNVNKYVLPGYQAIIDAMNECMVRDDIGKLLAESEDGKRYYELLLKNKTTSSITPQKAAEMLDKALADWGQEREELLNSIPSIYSGIVNKTNVYQTRSSVVDMLNTHMKNDFPDLSIEWSTIDMPESMNSFAGGLFYPPAFDTMAKEEKVYIGTSLTPGSSSYITTIAHEGAPGHLYHYSYIKQLPISNYRKFLGCTKSVGYLEGWTTYIEEIAANYSGLTKEESRIVQLDRLIESAVVQRLDIGVNYESWNQEAITDFIRNYPIYILMSSYLQDYVINSPCLMSSYVIGYLMLTDIKEDMKENVGDSFTDYEFHKQYLNVGPASYEIVRRELGL